MKDKRECEGEAYHLGCGTILKDRYEIISVIGFGGFGTIYKAMDCVLKQVVAIKEYYPTIFLNRIFPEKQVEVYDEKNIELFEKGKREFLEEARNLAKFTEYPNIVHVFDFFEENNTAYLIMEFLEGCNLREYLQSNKKSGVLFSLETSLQIIQCVLSALKAIHTSNIIHRDVKPANIFICKNGTVKLIDLGAARFADNENEKTRTIIITPGYAPAEQYQVKSKQGAYTDIYAVGAVLYEMLTGIKPDESINRKVKDEVLEPQILNKSIPNNVNSAIMRAMAIQPEIRFKNVELFSNALKNDKPVRNDKQEIKHHRIWKTVRIASLVIFSMAIILFSWKEYESRKTKAILRPAEISVWVPCEGDTQEETVKLVNQMCEEYLENNSMITIQVTALAKETYQIELQEALATGKGPTVFESSSLSPTDFQYLGEIHQLFDSNLLNTSNYYFLGSYSEYFPHYKQLPLTVDVPICYQNIGKNNGQNLPFDEAIQHTKEEIMDQRFCSYIGSIVDYGEIQNSLPGFYRISYPDLQNDIHTEFHDIFSINQNATEKEHAAAIRLLYYFLSETSQDYLTVQNNHFLPLNKNNLKTYEEVNGDFAGLGTYMNALEREGK